MLEAWRRYPSAEALCGEEGSSAQFTVMLVRWTWAICGPEIGLARVTVDTWLESVLKLGTSSLVHSRLESRLQHQALLLEIVD